MMKKSTFGIIIFISLLVLLVLVPPRLPLSALKLELAGDLERVTGCQVEIAALKFKVFPRPSFILSRVTLRSPGTADSGQLLYHGELITAALKITALLRGRLVVDSLVLKRPNFSFFWGEKNGLLTLVAWLSSALSSPEKVDGAGEKLLPGDSLMADSGSALASLRPEKGFKIRFIDGHWQLNNLPGLGTLEILHWHGIYRLKSAVDGKI